MVNYQSKRKKCLNKYLTHLLWMEKWGKSNVLILWLLSQKLLVQQWTVECKIFSKSMMWTKIKI